VFPRGVEGVEEFVAAAADDPVVFVIGGERVVVADPKGLRNN
jgi:hypothetical protein